MENPNFIRIPKESSLDEMSKFLEVDKDYLRRYHNIYCELSDLIEIDFPKHLVKLFVPPENKDYQEDLMSGGKVTLSSVDILTKNKLFHREYGVRQILLENEGEKNKISFLMEVKKIDNFQYSIKRNNIYVNNKATELISEQIAEKIGNVFSPLKVETIENGNLKQIINIEEIRSRWKSLRSEMVKYYRGEVAEKMLETVDDEMTYKNVIQNRILGSLFYRLYFLPFLDYVSSTEKFFDLYLPLFPFKKKIKYQVEVVKQQMPSEIGKMVLEIKGKLADNRTFSKMKNGTKALETEENDVVKCDGSFKASYKFNKDDGSIFCIEAEIVLRSEDNLEDKKIIFELYQQ